MATYALNESKMFSDIADGIAIIINSETGIYYGMNSLGTAVFDALMAGASAEAVLAALKALPGAPADMDARLTAFVDKLKEFDIVLDGNDGAGAVEVSIDAPVAEADEFALMVEEYNDAQELLLADPIHEVKEDTGWQPDKDALETDEATVQQKESKLEQ
ncbi:MULTISPECIES: PqqD family protein [unclassified Desulfovibrio]|uniref:PqqD family protein n=1 Tax=unclassified Desulfovibrio TaxID=2593640 RepID=UPI0013EC94FF|nr:MULTISPECIES: PqqD family protein [unclassified Desulfovibrio]